MTKSASYRNQARIFGVILATLTLLLSRFITLGGVTDKAAYTLGVLLATLCLLIFESFNVCVTCMLSCSLLYALGCVDTISGAFSGFSNHVLYFTTASFGLSYVFQKSALSNRLLSFLVGKKRLSTGKVTFLFMVCGAILSSIMSNVAAVVIFIPYVETYLSFYNDEEARKITKRSMMICLTVAVLIGGMMTPAGSSMNLICLDMLQRYAGTTVRFIDWMKIGCPLACLMLVIAYLIITAVYRREELSNEEYRTWQGVLHGGASLTGQDIYIGIVIACVVCAWIASSWIPSINITVTAIVGLTAMFLPGRSVMTWEEFAFSISWPTFFIAGNLISVASAVTETGLCAAFANQLLYHGQMSSEFRMVMAIALITFFIMALLPSAPAVITILSPIIIEYARQAGANPVMLVMTCALCVSNIYLFPLDAPLVVAYDRKAFTMFELPRATIWIQLSMILVVSVWMPFIFGIIA